MDFAAWCMEKFSIDVATLNEEQKAKFQALYDAAMAEEPAPEEVAAGEGDGEMTDEEKAKSTAAANAARARRARGTDGASADGAIEERAVRAMRAESTRVNRIRAMAGSQTELADRAITEGWTADRFELAVLRAGRSQHSGAAVQTGQEDEAQVMEAALLINYGMPADRLTAHFNQQILDRASHRNYRGFSLVECADRLRARAGIAYSGARNQQGHMTAVRDACDRLRANGFSSFTLSNILENAADKVLLDSYQAVVTVWQQICAVRSLSDFKIHAQYALDPTNTFKKVGPQGDLEQLKFSDRKYSLQAETYGVRFKIDYQTWRNDDLGSIQDRVAMVGQLGAATVEQIVFYMIMSGINSTSLFHTDNNNYLANSANYDLGVGGMQYAEKTIGNQVTAANTPLGIDDWQLVVGTYLMPVAGQLFTSTKLNETTTADKGKPADNPFVNKYKPVKAPYLNNSLLKDNTGAALSHQSDRLWMMFATQGNNASLYVGFLDGQQSPRIQVINNQSELIGFELEAGMHFGVGYGDPKMGFCANPANA